MGAEMDLIRIPIVGSGRGAGTVARHEEDSPCRFHPRAAIPTGIEEDVEGETDE